MSDDPATKPRAQDADDRVVSERMQSTPGATEIIGPGLDDADTQSEPGQIGSSAVSPAPVNGAIRATTYKLPGSREQVPATEASGAELRSIEANTVLLDRSGVERISAERVSMNRSGAKSLDAKSAQLDRSGVVALGSEHTVLLHSSAIQVVAEEARLSKSRAVFVTAERATLEDTRVMVLAGQVEGDVSAVFTRGTAAAFGAALGAVFALVVMLFSRRVRHTSK